jgi:hypothetical protein
MRNLVMTIFLVCSGLLADDVSDVEGLINEQIGRDLCLHFIQEGL